MKELVKNFYRYSSILSSFNFLTIFLTSSDLSFGQIKIALSVSTITKLSIPKVAINFLEWITFPVLSIERFFPAIIVLPSEFFSLDPLF